MRLKKVRVNGFSRIHEGLIKALEEHRTGYGSGFFNFLENAMISIEITELRGIELFFLKSFASDVIVTKYDYKRDNFFNKKEDEEIYKVIDDLIELNREIRDDPSIHDYESGADNILPIGCNVYNAVAIFSGPSITNITTLMIDKVFRDNDGKFDNNYIANIVIEQIISQMFVKSFYTYMADKLQEFDLVSEFTIKKEIYDYANEICDLAYVNTPFGELVFFNSDKEKLIEQISTINKGKETSDYDYSSATYLTYAMHTSFDTFMRLYANTKYVIHNQSFKIVFMDKKINIYDKYINEKYGIRIRDHINKLNEYKKMKSESTNVDIARFNLIYNGTMIFYLMKIPLNDVEKFSHYEEMNEYFKNTTNRIEKINIENSIYKKYQIVLKTI